ncbi:MAG: hypothetical protein ACP5I6_05060 [Caldisphaera sp.]
MDQKIKVLFSRNIVILFAVLILIVIGIGFYHFIRIHEVLT